MAKRGATSRLVHPRVAAELVLLANGDVLIHGGTGPWNHAIHRYPPVTIDERWLAASKRCQIEGPAGLPPADAVAWDLVRGCMQPVRRWPGKPTFGQLALAGGLTLKAGGKRPESAGRFGMRDSAIDAVTFEGPKTPGPMKLSVARADPTLTPLRDGRVVVSGGYTIAMDFSWEDVLRGVAAVDVIDPARGTVTRIADLSVGRYHHAAIEVAPGKLLVVGGSAQDGPPIDAVELLTV